ncbi:type II toxin-antitoxin system HicA family toxin [Micromonospora sp. MED01]|uniref:type II toxin-antitoxin system HicA family toxin n=1 Tax=Micromonospora alfalfae TaxID=2911212 RepID=UPI001EE93929|nr:type II toxin-antitoxin system HicA family toxin [Micromonospora alfalfae]MCG5464313.1 type II toxin-antitoxin system HicA family toxin [Micromonospora alfalfae]
MKRVDLIGKIGKAAADAGTTFDFVREGGSHTIYRYGSQNVVIPRHKEINENTAQGILRTLGLR